MGLAPHRGSTVKRQSRRAIEELVDAAGLTAPAWAVGAFGLAGALWTRKPLRPLAVGAGLVTALGIAVTVLPRRPQRSGQPTSMGGIDRPDPTATTVRIAAANVWMGNRTPAAAVEDLLALNADVLVVSEVVADMHERLSARFPHSLVIDLQSPSADFAHGVYTRFPLEQARHAPEIPGQAIVARIAAPEPFWLFALHFPRPVMVGRLGWGRIRPSGLRNAVNVVLAAAGALTEQGESVVLGGDLNLSDRTPGYRALARNFRDVMRTGWARTTYGDRLHWKATMLRIDHLLVSRSWTATNPHRVVIRGSDHQAIVADLSRTKA